MTMQEESASEGGESGSEDGDYINPKDQKQVREERKGGYQKYHRPFYKQNNLVDDLKILY